MLIKVVIAGDNTHKDLSPH